MSLPDRNLSRSLANAALLGWLPLLVINLVFASRVPMVLELGQGVLHQLYDAGQTLGLGVLSWLVVRALGLGRVHLAVRAAVASVLLVLTEHALLGGDLESFLDRHPKTHVPGVGVFGVLGAVGVAGAFVVGNLSARSRRRFAGVGLALAMAVANHLVLPLVYRGAHFTLAWCAAALLGMSLWRDLAARQPPRELRWGLLVASALSLLTFAVPASAGVRGALLSRSGAVAAPFVNGLWLRLQDEPEVPAALRASPWFRPRRDLRAIAPERMPGAPTAPIVILLTVDALRGDLLEGPMASKKVLPNLLKMRKDALHFERVWSPAAYTMASLRSLFLGTYYLQHAGRKQGELRRQAGQRASVPKTPFLAALLVDGGVIAHTFRASRMFALKGSVCRGFSSE